MSITTEIKEFGKYLGYCRVGITTTEDFDDYLDELNSRENYEFILKNNIVTYDPKRLMPSAKSIIVLLLDYKQKVIPENLNNMIGSIYLNRCYDPRPGSLNGARLGLMVDHLKDLGCEVRADIKIPARWAAARAGVATIGKNNFAYADGIGSYIVIYTLTLSAILNMDDEFFKTRIQPIMYNYISKPRMFRRNAIIAMGNSGDESYIKDLELAATSDDDLISRYAGWALENIRMNPGNKSE